MQHSRRRRRVQRFSFRSSFFLLLSKWLDGGCVKITSTNNPLFLDQTLKKFNMKFLVLAFLAFMATQALAQGEVFGKTETEMEDMVIVEGR